MANTKITSRVIADNAVGIPALAVSDGSNGQVLTTNGSGTLSFSTVSGTTINNNADNRVITGSGTANTLEGEANFVFDGSKLGVGTASPLKTVDIAGSAPYIRITDTRQASWSAGDKFGGIEWYMEDTSANAPLVGASIYAENAQSSSVPDQNLIFATAPHNDASGPTERMRILSAGNVGIGTTSPGNLLEVSHDANAHTAVLRITGTSSSAYAGGLEFYTGYGGGKVIHNTFATASGGNGGEYWQELRNQSSNTLKRTYHVSNSTKHTFYGQHNGDSTGHFLFTNSLHDSASTNCSLVVQNGYTFIQIMGWTSLGARIGTRTAGWSGNSGGDVYLTRQDATSIKLASSGPQLSNGTAISSDERLKENITDIADGQLAKINALTPRNFTWKDTRKTGTHEGFIAQEVEAVIPEAVYEDNWAPDPDDDSRDFEGDIKLIRHEVINARLIKAVQELTTRLEAAEAKIKTLEG